MARKVLLLELYEYRKSIMSKFDFNHSNDSVLAIRMSDDTATKIRQIAKKEKVTIQEVCREFLRVAVEEYLNQPDKEQL